MPTSSTATRTRRSFTLLELIVVIVILGVLAALAVPTFTRVTAKAEAADTSMTLAAVTREAGALAAFRGETEFTIEDFDAAIADLSAAPSVGVSAATDQWSRVSGDQVSTSPSQVSIAIGGTPVGAKAGLALITDSGWCGYALATSLSGGVTTWTSDSTDDCAGDVALVGPDADEDPVPEFDAPPAPTGVTTAPATSAVTVTWNGVPHADDAPVTGYRVFRDGLLAAVIPAPATSATILGLSGGVDYAFTVAAYGPGGQSAQSSPPTSGSPHDVPATPTNLYATPGNESVTLSWDPVASTDAAPVSGYRIYVDGAYRTQTTDTNYVVTGLTNGTEYAFSVAAYGLGGQGAASPDVTATPSAAPAAPTNLAATPYATSVDLTWDEVVSSPAAPVSGYRVFRDGLQVAQTTDPSATISSLSAGTTYTFTVASFGVAGQSAQSAPLDVTTLTAPPVPANVTATPTNGQVTLTWDAVTNTAGAPLSGYRVYRDGLQVAQLPGTSAVITGLTNGTEYSFSVAAYGLGGQSAASSSVNATPSAAPAPPTNLAATPYATSVDLTWDEVVSSPAAPVSGYRVFRDGLQVAQTTDPSATISGLATGTTYSFTVASFGIAGQGVQTAPVTATTLTAPATPTGVTPTAGNGAVTVSWNAVANTAGAPVSGYRIYVDGAYRTQTTDTNYVVTGLTNGTEYAFSVAAYGLGGQSAASSSVNATPSAAPAPPTNLVASPAGATSVNLTWDAVTSSAAAPVSGYRVYRDGLQVAQTTDTSVTVSSLTAGTTYNFTVATYGIAGQGIQTAPVTATTLTAPATPTGLSATAGVQRIDVSWAAVSNTAGAPVSGYRVYLDGNQVWQGSGTSAALTGLTGGVPRSVQVAAYGLGGQSSPSASLTRTPSPPLTVSYASGNMAASSAVISPTVANAAGAVSYSVTAGTVPASVSFNPSTGQFTGPVSPGTLTAISVGQSSSCGIDSNGAAWCWGRNHVGQLGIGSLTPNQSNVPVQVSGLTSGVTAISVGTLHTCAIQSGSAWCWGYGNNGRLGNNSTATSTAPAQVSGLTSGVTAISAGTDSTCAVQSGAAKCWGAGTNGRLGNNSATQSLVPVQVYGLTSGVTAVSTRDSSACAIQSGAAKCWGANSSGKLGNNSTTESLVPVQVDGLTSNVTAITTQSTAACAIQSGAAKCWGAGGWGRLGNNSATDSWVPTQVSGLTSGVTAITGKDAGACAIQSGAAKCWGSNDAGQTGNGTTNDPLLVPTQVSGLTSGVTTIASSMWHSCAIQSGAAKCWGLNGNAQLGNNSTTQSLVPVDVYGFSPWPGFPASLTVTASDGTTTVTAPVTLSR